MPPNPPESAPKPLGIKLASCATENPELPSPPRDGNLEVGVCRLAGSLRFAPELVSVFP